MIAEAETLYIAFKKVESRTLGNPGLSASPLSLDDHGTDPHRRCTKAYRGQGGDSERSEQCHQ